MKSDILGVLVDDVTPEETLEKIEEFVRSGQPHYVVTPNPEIVMAAQGDPELIQALNGADLSVADGTGLALASRLSGRPIRKRVTGADLVWQVAGLAEKKGYSIYFLGTQGGAVKDAAAKAAAKLKDRFPDLKIAGIGEGMRVEREEGLEMREITGVIEAVNEAKPDILLVGFGAPRQEKWMAANIGKLKTAKVIIGIGGALDLASGEIRRAPKLLRKAGLEWLWRLIIRPQKIGRIWTAVVRFPLAVFRDKFLSNQQ